MLSTVPLAQSCLLLTLTVTYNVARGHCNAASDERGHCMHCAVLCNGLGIIIHRLKQDTVVAYIGRVVTRVQCMPSDDKTINVLIGTVVGDSQ